MRSLTEMLSRAKDNVALIERAMDAEKALDWLRRHGPEYDGVNVGRGDASVTLKFAGSVEGARQAERFMDAAAFALLPQIVATATKVAEQLVAAAQGIEAATAGETEGLDGNRESPVGFSRCARTFHPSHPIPRSVK